MGILLHSTPGSPTIPGDPFHPSRAPTGPSGTENRKDERMKALVPGVGYRPSRKWKFSENSGEARKQKLLLLLLLAAAAFSFCPGQRLKSAS